MLLDCIALGIPIIGFVHPLFEQLQARVGEIGHFCLPGDELIMLKTLREKFSLDHYRTQCANIGSLRNTRNPVNMGGRIRSLLGD